MTVPALVVVILNQREHLKVLHKENGLVFNKKNLSDDSYHKILVKKDSS